MQQTHRVSEILVVDDGSTDGTGQLFKSQNSAIRFIPLGCNYGAQHARNVGIKHSRGDWIAFLDSDDEWLPVRVERAIEVAGSTGCEISYCAFFRQTGVNDRRVHPLPQFQGNIYVELLKQSFTTFPGLFVKRTCFEKAGYLDESIISWQEWDTSINLARLYSFAAIPEPLFTWHWHDMPTISKDLDRDAKGYLQVVEKHRPEILSRVGKHVMIGHYLKVAQKYIAIGDKHQAKWIKTKVETLLEHSIPRGNTSP
jgi:glycosyltransferase involved in cell wall biosynthesis